MEKCGDYIIGPSTLNVVQGCLDTAVELDLDGFGPKQGETIVEILQRDIITFCAYLAQCDGELDSDEVDFINMFFRQELEPDQIAGLVRNKEIEDESWLQKPCRSFDYFLKPKLLNTPESKGKYYNITNVYYKAFDRIGHEVMSCNRDFNDEQLLRITDYLCMLREYIKKEQLVYQEEEQEVLQEELNAQVTIHTNAEVTHLEKTEIDELIEEMNDFIGLESVKQEVQKLISFIKVNKLRKENGLKVHEFSNHLVFLGNPGTGKTTFARLLAKIYYALGVAETDKFVEVDRSGLVAGFVGQTSQKVQEVIDQAKGGVLFIDEAYALSNNGGDNDFGREAIDILTKAMEDLREELIVIVAGYPEPMNEFLDINPGFRSRFNRTFVFEDYTTDELMKILEGMEAKLEYRGDGETKKFIRSKIQEKLLQKTEDFANARAMRNYLEAAILKQSQRLVQQTEIQKEDLTTLKVEDFEGITFA